MPIAVTHLPTARADAVALLCSRNWVVAVVVTVTSEVVVEAEAAGDADDRPANRMLATTKEDPETETILPVAPNPPRLRPAKPPPDGPLPGERLGKADGMPLGRAPPPKRAKPPPPHCPFTGDDRVTVAATIAVD